MERPIETITVVGVGLIGGSVAAAAKAAGASYRIRGISRSEESLKTGLEQGILDEAAELGSSQAAKWTSRDGSDLVVLCTPADQMCGWLDTLAAQDFDGILTDAASTKHMVCSHAAKALPHPELFIPGHPMAGRETSGIGSASPKLFEGAYWILCPDERTDPDAYQALHEFVVSLSARVISIPREEHDKAIAIVSHVPHMVASSLVRLAGKHAESQPNLLRLAAGGFKDSTRIAAGSPKLWCGIAFDNSSAISSGLSEMGKIISQFAEAIENRDEEALSGLLEYSAKVRGGLPAKWIPSSERLVECRIPMFNRSGVIAEVTTIASKAGCNVQSIDIDHVSEASAVLELIFTDEGDIGRLTGDLINAGYNVSLRPLSE